MKKKNFALTTCSLALLTGSLHASEDAKSTMTYEALGSAAEVRSDLLNSKEIADDSDDTNSSGQSKKPKEGTCSKKPSEGTCSKKPSEGTCSKKPKEGTCSK